MTEIDPTLKNPTDWGLFWTPEGFVVDRNGEQVFCDSDLKVCYEFFKQHCSDEDTIGGLLTGITYWNPENNPYDVGVPWQMPESLDGF